MFKCLSETVQAGDMIAMYWLLQVKITAKREKKGFDLKRRKRRREEMTENERTCFSHKKKISPSAKSVVANFEDEPYSV